MGTMLAASGSAVPPLLATEADAEVAPSLSPLLPQGTRAEAVLDTLPGKKPLIKLSYRPPNYEAPIEYLRTTITPNDEFFVRYHLSDIPRGGCQGLEADDRRGWSERRDRARAG